MLTGLVSGDVWLFAEIKFISEGGHSQCLQPGAKPTCPHAYVVAVFFKLAAWGRCPSTVIPKCLWTSSLAAQNCWSHLSAPAACLILHRVPFPPGISSPSHTDARRGSERSLHSQFVEHRALRPRLTACPASASLARRPKKAVLSRQTR